MEESAEGRSDLLLREGLAALATGRPADALEQLSQATAVASELGAGSQLGSALAAEAAAYLELGLLEAALDRSERALARLLPQASVSGDAVRALTVRAVALAERGEAQAAVDAALRALGTVDGAPVLSDLRAACLAALGEARLASRHLQGAIDAFSLALDSATDGGQFVEAAATLDGLARVYIARGNFAHAHLLARGAASITGATLPNSPAHARHLCDVGAALVGKGAAVEGAQVLNESLALQGRIASGTHREARALRFLGLSRLDDGDVVQAIDSFQAALDLNLRVRPTSLETAIDLAALAAAEAARRHYSVAWHHARAAERIVRATAPRSLDAASILALRADVSRYDGDLRAAIRYGSEAVEVAEEASSRVGTLHARERLFARHNGPFQTLIACLYFQSEPGAHEQAFHFAERSRGRQLLQALADRRASDEAAPAATTSLLDTTRVLKRRLVHARNSLVASAAAPGRTLSIARVVEDLERELERTQDAMRRALATDDDNAARRPTSVAEVQAALDSDTLLLEYDATGDEAFVWAIRHDRFVMFAVAGPGGTLDALVSEVVDRYQPVAGPTGPYAESAVSRLGELLLGTVPAEHWEGVRRVLVVPDGTLHYLPFELLPVPGGDGELLGDRATVGYAPSASAWLALRALPPVAPTAGDLMAIGDPAFVEGTSVASQIRSTLRAYPIGPLVPLPTDRLEVAAIAALFPGRAATYFGASATEARVRSESRGYRYVHFATHGLVFDADPETSGIALAPPTDGELAADPWVDDFLQVAEMSDLDLSAAEVVFFSACRTGRGQVTPGEGLVGFSQALFASGARCLILTLWPVRADVTRFLAPLFYRALVDGLSPADALRGAKRAARDHFRDPYLWAAFVPVGLPW